MRILAEFKNSKVFSLVIDSNSKPDYVDYVAYDHDTNRFVDWDCTTDHAEVTLEQLQSRMDYLKHLSPDRKDPYLHKSVTLKANNLFGETHYISVLSPQTEGNHSKTEWMLNDNALNLRAFFPSRAACLDAAIEYMQALEGFSAANIFAEPMVTALQGVAQARRNLAQARTSLEVALHEFAALININSPESEVRSEDLKQIAIPMESCTAEQEEYVARNIVLRMLHGQHKSFTPKGE